MVTTSAAMQAMVPHHVPDERSNRCTLPSERTTRWVASSTSGMMLFRMLRRMSYRVHVHLSPVLFLQLNVSCSGHHGQSGQCGFHVFENNIFFLGLHFNECIRNIR